MLTEIDLTDGAVLDVPEDIGNYFQKSILIKYNQDGELASFKRIKMFIYLYSNSYNLSVEATPTTMYELSKLNSDVKIKTGESGSVAFFAINENELTRVYNVVLEETHQRDYYVQVGANYYMFNIRIEPDFVGGVNA